ncbi:MAG: hypothetical protein OEQ81_05570 [Flavobacteriaceae bacterium]|nr:hypothetical protein [Flavobacteriaceae bacterium]
MKKIAGTLLIVATLISCGDTKTKAAENQPQERSAIENTSEVMASADYSTLLTEYSCDMDIDELAGVLGVSASDLSLPDQASPNGCTFELKGYGENPIGGQTRLYWNTSKNSKEGNKKEIATYLKNQEEMPENISMGMGIELAETKDCYIAFQPAHGRVIILNENYDNMFLLSYGTPRTLKTRTEEQHNELRGKMTQLANYLLKKHKK